MPAVAGWVDAVDEVLYAFMAGPLLLDAGEAVGQCDRAAELRLQAQTEARWRAETAAADATHLHERRLADAHAEHLVCVYPLVL